MLQPPYRDWGEKIDSGVIQAKNYKCPWCEKHHQEPGLINGIGFVLNPPDKTTRVSFAIVYQCTKCGTKFWYHVYGSSELEERIRLFRMPRKEIIIEEPKQYQTWGENISGKISLDDNCPNCHHNQKSIIGLNAECELSGEVLFSLIALAEHPWENNPYILIAICSNCQTQFWFYTNKQTISKLIAQNKIQKEKIINHNYPAEK